MKYLSVKAVDRTYELTKPVLGSANFGLNISRDEAYAIMDKYYELGGNAIDTARSYGGEIDPSKLGVSEGIVASWIKDRGLFGKVIFMTKGAFSELDEHYNFIRLRVNEKEIREDFEATWENVGLPYIDVYMLHRDDPTHPVSEFVDVLDEFVKQGRVKALGASNWSLDRIREANAYALANGKTPFTVSEIQWSLPQTFIQDETCVFMNPEIYADYMKHGIPIVSFSSQARGLFINMYNGKFDWDTMPEEMRGAMDRPINREKFRRMSKLCDERGLNAASVGLAYISCNPLPGAPIIGSWSVHEVEDSMKDVDLELSEADIRWLDARD